MSGEKLENVPRGTFFMEPTVGCFASGAGRSPLLCASGLRGDVPRGTLVCGRRRSVLNLMGGFGEIPKSRASAKIGLTTYGTWRRSTSLIVTPCDHMTYAIYPSAKPETELGGAGEYSKKDG
jgi:hypothetical protein